MLVFRVRGGFKAIRYGVVGGAKYFVRGGMLKNFPPLDLWLSRVLGYKVIWEGMFIALLWVGFNPDTDTTLNAGSDSCNSTQEELR
ncbi:hypothetical protein AHF37_12718 [Paragonimus kellicotti]|nr:hypothetical protein AHF37_12718 [Paragonimus kellicotti]